MDRIHGHNEGILEIRRSVKPAILATILVPFQDTATFFRCHWLGQTGQAEYSTDRPERPLSTFYAPLCAELSAKRSQFRAAP